MTVIPRVVASVLMVLSVLQAPASAQTSCQFVLGFASLRDQLGSDRVGDCLEDQISFENGDARQRTTKGELIWRRTDSVTGYTDGYRTWMLGPNGLESRLNTERLPWEVEAATQVTATASPAVVVVVVTATPIPSSATAPPVYVQPVPQVGLTPELNARCFRLSTEFGLEFASTGGVGATGALMSLCEMSAQQAVRRGVECFEWGTRQSLSAARRGGMVPGLTMSLIQQCIMSGQR